MENKIAEVVEFYEQKEVDRLVKMTRFVTHKIEVLLRKKKILARVASRVKSADSLQAKLEEWSKDKNKCQRLNGSPTEVLRAVSDLAAARVMTYTEQDRATVAEVVQELFDSPPECITPFDIEHKEETDRIKDDARNHYRATHMMLCIKEDDLIGEYWNLPNDRCELQITSFLAHVWNEIEHDTVYKALSGDLSDLESDAIDSLGHLTKTGDTIIKNLIRAREFREDKEHDKLNEESKRIRNTEELVAFMYEHYGEKINNKKIYFSNGAKEFLNALEAVNWHHPTDIIHEFSPNFLNDARKETLKLMRFLDRRGSKKPKIEIDTMDMFTVGLCMKRLNRLEVEMLDVHGSNRTKLIFNAFKDMSER